MLKGTSAGWRVAAGGSEADSPNLKTTALYSPYGRLNPTMVTLTISTEEVHRRDGEATAAFTHRLIGADGVDLRPEHDSSEDQKEETLKAEEDEEDDGRWWGEVTALWRGGRAERERFITLKRKSLCTTL